MTISGRTLGLVAAGVLAGGLVSGGVPALAQEATPGPDSSATAPAVPGDGERDGRDCPEEDSAAGGAGDGAGTSSSPAAPAPSASSEV